MRTAIVSTLLLLAAALSGCAGDTPAPADDDQDPVPEGEAYREPEVFSGQGEIVASGVLFALGGAAVEFNVKEGTALIYAEIQWDDPVQDINLALSSPSAGDTAGARNYDHIAEGGSPGAPDSPHSLSVASPEAGGWAGSAFANGPGGGVTYTIAVTLFYEETAVPDGYSALP